jgi:hypothetical protein
MAKGENLIVIGPGDWLWTSLYIGPHAANVQRLFGTTILPTNYGLTIPLETVVAAIQGLNPGVAVRGWRESDKASSVAMFPRGEHTRKS